jgi:hypothetical protein
VILRHNDGHIAVMTEEGWVFIESPDTDYDLDVSLISNDAVQSSSWALLEVTETCEWVDNVWRGV